MAAQWDRPRDFKKLAYKVSQEFALVDAEGSGKLPRDMVRKVFQKLGIGPLLDTLLQQSASVADDGRVVFGRLVDMVFGVEDARELFGLCDASGSGSLSRAELRIALRAAGVEPTEQELTDAMSSSSEDAALSFEAFQRLFDTRSTKFRTTRPPIVPHARRGMTLTSLKTLVHLFVRSGWLQLQCDLLNSANPDAEFKRAANLYALDELVVKPITDPKESASCAARLEAGDALPMAQNVTSSFSELLEPVGLTVNTFVSHYWGHPFEDTVKALEEFTKLWPADPVFWICLFALNQHQPAEEVGTSPKTGPFNAALRFATDGAVMVVDRNIHPFSRIWCIFEVAQITDIKKPFELVSSLGPLTTLATASVADDGAAELVRKVADALDEVSATGAKSSNENDRQRILLEVADKGSRQLLRSRAQAGKAVGNSVLDAMFFREFDATVRALLATTLLRRVTRECDTENMIKWMRVGAAFEAEHVALLMKNGGSAEHLVDKLLCIAAEFGHTEATQALLRLDGALAGKLGARTGREALNCAATRGHLEIAKHLLAAGVDVGPVSGNGHTPLMAAATHGNVDVAKLLLAVGADARAALDDGNTVLMGAALCGHAEMVGLLLAAGADVAPSNSDGFTALMRAAEQGHREVVAQLLGAGADVTAAAMLPGTGPGGLTALKLAEDMGHEEVAGLLR